jgi:membrane protease YdiL (CAAX protease family)
MSFFLNSDHQLRSGWKFAIYIVFLILVGVPVGILLTMFTTNRGGIQLLDQLVQLALNQVSVLMPAIGATWLSIKFVDHRPFSAFGIGLLPDFGKHFVIGLGIAAAMLGVLIAGCFAFGYVSIHWTGGQVPPGTLLATLGILVVAAATEELIFRGFLLQVLIDGLGQWPAIIIMSVLFAAVHVGNPNSSQLGILNTVAAGVLLSLAYVKTGSLWLPYAIHLGWNAGLGFVFGFPLSGIDLASLWTTGTAGSETILGGGYGPEGGLLCTFVFSTAALMLNKHGSFHSTETPVGSRLGRDHRDRA